MNTDKDGRILDYFPVAVFGAYLLYEGLICAIFTHDPRLLRLSFVAAPAVLAVLYAFFRVGRRKGTDDPL